MFWIAMRFVDGQDAKNLLKRAGPARPERAADIIAPVASALSAAHGKGLVHRDVKPANILLALGEGDDDGHVYLSDFGVAKHSASRALTKTGMFVGTAEYASPEQIEGKELDGRADVYSLGCVLYECLTRRAGVRPGLRGRAHVRPPARAAAVGDRRCDRSWGRRWTSSSRRRWRSRETTASRRRGSSRRRPEPCSAAARRLQRPRRRHGPVRRRPCCVGRQRSAERRRRPDRNDAAVDGRRGRRRRHRPGGAPRRPAQQDWRRWALIAGIAGGDPARADPGSPSARRRRRLRAGGDSPTTGPNPPPPAAAPTTLREVLMPTQIAERLHDRSDSRDRGSRDRTTATPTEGAPTLAPERVPALVLPGSGHPRRRLQAGQGQRAIGPLRRQRGRAESGSTPRPASAVDVASARWRTTATSSSSGRTRRSAPLTTWTCSGSPRSRGARP